MFTNNRETWFSCPVVTSARAPSVPPSSPSVPFAGRKSTRKSAYSPRDLPRDQHFASHQFFCELNIFFVRIFRCSFPFAYHKYLFTRKIPKKYLHMI